MSGVGVGAGKSSRLRGPKMTLKYKNFYVMLFLILIVGIVVTGIFQFWPHDMDSDQDSLSRHKRSQYLNYHGEITIKTNSAKPLIGNESCTFHTCFNVSHCGYNDENRISVYIYPLVRYLDENDVSISIPLSKEFHEILTTIANSDFYTENADEACLFLPSLDLLNQNNVRLDVTAQVLQTLPRWNNGTNHLLFNMLPGNMPDYNTTLDVHRGLALLAGGGFSTWSYRRNFDVPIPVYNPMISHIDLPEISYLEKRRYLFVAGQTGIHTEYRADLEKVASTHKNVLVLDKCTMDPTDTSGKFNFTQRCREEKKYNYPHILQHGTFCIVLRGARLGQTALYDCMKASSIPVIIADSYIMPFSEVLDWERAAVVVREDDLADIGHILEDISIEKIHSMRKQVKFYYETYFATIKDITLTTLQIINDRVFPYAGRKYEEWNEPPYRDGVVNPLFLPLMPPKSAGFTAVILTFDRLESLFRVITEVAKTPSLSKVLVVWNNQKKLPPQASLWPKINKPLKVVQTRQNKLSNRFYPYDEIETEAILALDDDIVMMTTDELEFGYQVWREFPDRLVGFPSRLHLWDNTTQKWKYESEWTSEISMVLTGAAFYHKHYSFLYTNAMPGNLKKWVDKHINCEDIAMNFLIANHTRKGAVKVAPRQKFKCPECKNMDMLSADATHLVERSECVHYFTQLYEAMPLKTVEFRADPVLYKDDFPDNLKSYSNIGSL
ncbi:unnamed protein product [Owenia fusiformis]|uniref:Exostosin-2 n=1 Tax=Owenia fusiformis TaxID=6347 RepID=A0A8J1TDG7_OWEFU|nr:unnamed protein product [Owenia fusiformis]